MGSRQQQEQVLSWVMGPHCLGMVPLAGQVPLLEILSVSNRVGLLCKVKGTSKSKLVVMLMKSRAFFYFAAVTCSNSCKSLTECRS